MTPAGNGEVEASKVEAPKAEQPKAEATKPEATKNDVVKEAPPKRTRAEKHFPSSVPLSIGLSAFPSISALPDAN